jgi:hypothetical protein
MGGNDRKEERQNYGTRIPMLAYGQINAVKLKAMSTTNKTVTRPRMSSMGLIIL